MKKYLKYLIVFVIACLLYFSNVLFFKTDTAYYKSLDTIQVPPLVFAIVWPIIYVLMSGFIAYYFFAKPKVGKEMWILLGINFVTQYLFTPLFFGLKSPLLGFICTALTFVTILLITIKAYEYNRKTAIVPIPYVLWTAFATFLSFITFLKN